MTHVFLYESLDNTETEQITQRMRRNWWQKERPES